MSAQLEAGRALHQAGKLDEAELIYRRVLGDEPNNVQALNLLWSLLSQRANFPAALEAIQSAVRCRPSDPTLRYNLGTALMNVGQAVAAAKAYREVLKRRPDFADCHFSLGRALQLEGKLEEAERSFRRSLQIDPASGPAHNHLGLILMRLGKPEEAAASFERALVINPNSPQAHSNLGSALFVLSRHAEAEESYRQALRLNGRLAAAHTGLADALFALGKGDQGMAHYREGIQYDPDSSVAHANMGVALRRLGRIPEAASCLQRAVELEPGVAATHTELADSLLMLGSLEEAEQHHRKALALAPLASGSFAFFLNYAPGRSASEIYAQHRQYGHLLAQSQSTTTNHHNVPDPERPIRVGYISPDFRQHSVAFFVEPVLANHDQANCEITCYNCYNTSVYSDATTKRLRSMPSRWRDVYGMSDAALVRLIEEDAIDILVDLAGITLGSRLTVLARKPAPVQVTWLGYPTMTGLPSMDFRITDVHVDGPGLPTSETEVPIRLAPSYFCYGGPREDAEVGPLPALLTSGNVTFGSFNSLAKVNGATIGLWSKVLRAIPGSRLLLKCAPLANPRVRADVRQRFVDTGIDSERLVLQEQQPTMGEHLASYHQVDIGLDTFPYNGATTTCEALWMGVPIVSLFGETHASRMGKSILTAAGLGEFVCGDEEAFVAKCIATAGDLPSLAALRAKLREQVRSSPLMDATCFTRNLEEVYRQMWREWCASRRS